MESHLEILLAQSFAGLVEAVLRSAVGALEGELGQAERLELTGMLELTVALEQESQWIMR